MRFWKCLAWKLPKKLVYWAGMRMFARVTSGENALDAGQVKVIEMFDRWMPGKTY